MQRNIPINQVSWLCTHNAFNSNDEIKATAASIGGTNQNHDIKTQLADGVRAFMIDVHNFHNAARVGHGEGAKYNYEDLVDLLKKFRSWLRRNPQEIVILMMEVASDVPADWIDKAFTESGLHKKLYEYNTALDNLGGIVAEQASDMRDTTSGIAKIHKAWPSVNELVLAKKRVVVFRETDDNKGRILPANMGWYHKMWRYWIETPYGNSHWQDLQQHTYKLLRGNPATACFFNLNHFTNTGNTGSGSAGFAQGMNTKDYLLSRALIAWKMHGRRPSISVDFYKSLPGAAPEDTYNTLEVAEEINNTCAIQGTLKIDVQEASGIETRVFVHKVTWEGLSKLSFGDYLPGDYRLKAGSDGPGNHLPSSNGGDFSFPSDGMRITLTPVCAGYTFTPASIAWDGRNDKLNADFIVTKD